MEVIEVCPYCDYENEYINPRGFIKECKNCGKKIFLCDKCLHWDDDDFCDWNEGKCHRGCIKEYSEYIKEG